ncbi:MAG TPA: MMPL family transporter [Candidatus Saccharimonadales bacterium]
MKRFAEFVVRRRWWILATWLVAAILIVGLSPTLTSVESNDQSSFLPKGYESIEAINVSKQISPHSQNATDIIVFTANGKVLTASDKQAITNATKAVAGQHLAHISNITSSSSEVSKDGKVELGQISYGSDGQDTGTINAVKAVRDALTTALDGSGVSAGVTGAEAISYDTQDASQRALKIVGLGTLLLVLILPALVFRSPLAGLLPIVSVGVVYTIASSLIADAATLFNFKVNQQLSIMFTVVLFGIGTDYILFLLFRYRERLRTGEHTKAAVAFALGRAGEAILSAALVVLTSFTALFFAKFGIFSSMAPGLVICVAVMMFAAVTLVPALIAVIEQKVFWPSKAWKSPSLKPTISKRIGGMAARQPARLVAIVGAFLVVLSGFALTYKSDFSSFSQPPKGTQSASAYNTLVNAFPAGVLDPSEVYVSSSHALTTADIAPLRQALQNAQGVSSLAPTTFSKDSKTAVIAVTLKDDPYSSAAINNVAGPIRAAAHSAAINGSHVYVGGSTAVIVDMRAVTNRDLRVIFPIAAAFIFIILAVLLRSLVAPIFLLLCVGLGYIATLGASSLIFLKFGGDPGLIFFIPLFMYIFVVAIGTDYNILTITRLREEVRGGMSPRRAADMTVEHSSATVASAGLILAATFGSLLLAGISFLTQMGTAIALGVALAAFVIAPFLIPSLSALLGYAIWWPGHKPKKTAK